MRLTNEAAHVFWERVRRGDPVECWEWQGYRQKKGYGSVWLPGQKRPLLTHRVSYALSVEDPGRRCVLHRCDNPPCCNPHHLFLGTRRDNSDDKVAKGRQTKGSSISNAKLDEARVVELLELFATGEHSQAALARRYGVATETVRAVILGRAWKHVQGPRLSREAVRQIGARHNSESSRRFATRMHLRRRRALVEVVGTDGEDL